jgi:uncharacterized membrane protein
VRAKPLFFALVVLFTAIYLRMPYFVNTTAINPDEADLLATAKLAAQSWFPYENYTTTNFGPIWPEFLGIFKSVGFSFTFQFAHILSFALLLIGFLLFQVIDLTLRKDANWMIYGLYALIDFAVFSPATIEFSFLATETLPIALASIMLIFLMTKKRSSKTLYFSGSFFGLAVLAKYQAIPIGVIAVIFIFVYCCQKNSLSTNFNEVLKFLAGTLLTFFGIFVWVFLGGGLQKFLIDSVGFSFSYSTGGMPGFQGGLGFIRKLQNGTNLIWGEPIVLLIIFWLLALILISRPDYTRDPGCDLTVSKIPRSPMIITCIIVGFLIVSIPGNYFPHYLLFFIWTLQVSGSLLNFGEFSEKLVKNHVPLFNAIDSKTIPAVFLLMTSFVFSANQSKFLDTIRLSKQNQVEANFLLESKINNLSEQGLELCPKNSQVFIWGWAAEYFTLLDWNPPDDLVNDSMRIFFGFNEEVVAKRIYAAVSSNKTSCIFEAIGPNYFFNISPLDNLQKRVPSVNDFLISNYRKIELTPEYGTVWVRKN